MPDVEVLRRLRADSVPALLEGPPVAAKGERNRISKSFSGSDLNREERDELRVAQDLLRRIRRRPAQQSQKVAEGLGHDAQLAVGDHRGGAVALGEPRLVGAEDERHMREDGQRRYRL